MGVQPQSRERLWPATCIHLLIEECGYRRIIELNGNAGAFLRNQPHIIHEQ
jgi:hypothetical protein